MRTLSRTMPGSTAEAGLDVLRRLARRSLSSMRNTGAPQLGKAGKTRNGDVLLRNVGPSIGSHKGGGSDGEQKRLANRARSNCTKRKRVVPARPPVRESCLLLIVVP